MLQKVTEAFQEYYYLRLHKIHQFEPKVVINQRLGSFRLKTADSIEELKQAFQLRHEVFQNELRGLKNRGGWDIDQYDFLCDHIVIIDEKTKRVCATFRMNDSQHSSTFYSSREFVINRLLNQPGNKTEIGRVCIRREYRRGFIVSLLWKGVAEYLAKTQSQLLFGCASFQIRTARQAALLHRYFFEKKKYTAEYFCPPTLAYKMQDFEAWSAHYRRPLTREENAEAELLIPSLFASYLKMGAYLGGEPAWDESFLCFDFLTALQAENLNRYLWQKS